ncbi:DNA (cytosine-5)-methyltransferase [Lachnellula hyalina]|uniref:DNA (cytosine-5-)-methyltransferase n=1 Tax=Lachnellula hyalina TaxID=1316788 RepID=A0A8H8QXR0_9HELO|nr:DNA (cytosine-5)-methyltransferase [Lachnellula hyalina]TVY24674.1 DNA (cytosine-5)-methyltransferase [Lachnellula hyalina]
MSPPLLACEDEGQTPNSPIERYYDAQLEMPPSSKPQVPIADQTQAELEAQYEEQEVVDNQNNSVQHGSSGLKKGATDRFPLPEHLQASSTPMESSTASSDVDMVDLEWPLENDLMAQEAMHEIIPFSERPQNSQNLKHIKVSELSVPKSRYTGNIPPLPISKEQVAVQELLQEFKSQQIAASTASGRKPPSILGSTDDDYVEFVLSDFSIYLPYNKFNPFEMRPLNHLSSKHKSSEFLFDGVLSLGNSRHYVQAVPFNICSIGNYGEDEHEVGDSIWLQSHLNLKKNIYYRLGAPAPEYFRFHTGFKWLADLSKHFVDYCHTFDKYEVSVFDFRTSFSQWLEKMHASSSGYQQWRQKYGKADFRQPISANIRFLWKEAMGVDSELMSNPIWAELMEMNHIPMQQITESKTVVTPYIYECFKHMKFGHHLKSVEFNSVTHTQHLALCKGLNLTPTSSLSGLFAEIPSARTTGVEEKTTEMEKLEHENKVKNINVGDVLSVTKDGADSVWKDEISKWKALDNCWYVYVQGVHDDGDERSFDALWLYRPSDTSCAMMRYPFANELFLSDNCTCKTGKITTDEILDVVSVSWDPQPPNSARQLFIRQTYLENEIYVTCKEDHKQCEHLRARQAGGSLGLAPRFKIGQTVLVEPRHKKHGLEAYEIVRYEADGNRWNVILRQLWRRRDIDRSGRPNELVYTDKTEKVLASKVKQTCLVRFYSEDDIKSNNIPAPYSRDGTGNAFYITCRYVESGTGYLLKPIVPNTPKSLIQGFDPSAPPRKTQLRGMDLYCGGGNLGRGLEEGGAVHNEWAVDNMPAAIHTYYANLKTPTSTKLFHGSVNDLLIQAMAGNPQNSDLIPSPGDVDVLSAGSPCQGFSILNNHRDAEKGLRNQSLVASVAAYIDFYRPKYPVLENVMNMAQKGRGRNEDVLSQLICAIVGIGYQVRLFVIDSWSCGSPQARSRLFVSVTAPGLEPPEHPRLSHSHPPNIGHRGLGKLANGELFGRRLHVPTPFKYVTAGEACRDLPDIGDGQTYQCIPFPYHVTPIGMTVTLKLQMRAIPTRPYGMTFAKAWDDGKGVMSKEEMELFPFISKDGTLRRFYQHGAKGWGRMIPTDPFPTVVTLVSPNDAHVGRCLHWDEHRTISISECQQAQSFPDTEVLVGTPPQHLRIIGNSVARTVSLALGLSLRDAWVKSAPNTLSSSCLSTLAEHPKSRVTQFGKRASSFNENSNPPQRTSSTNNARIDPLVSNKSKVKDVPRIVIPDSDESSGESSDEPITKESFSRFPRSFEIRKPAHAKPATRVSVKSGGAASSHSNDSTSSERSSLKRPHSMVQDTRIVPPTRKSAFLSTTESERDPSKRGNSSSVSASRNRSLVPPGKASKAALSTSRRASKSNNVDSTEVKGKVVDSGHLTESLQAMKQELQLLNPRYFADENADSESDGYLQGESDSEDSDTDSPTPALRPRPIPEKEIPRSAESSLSAQKRRFEDRVIQTSRTGVAKLPTKPASNLKVVINLISDDEDADADKAKKTKRPAVSPTVRPPTSRYVPVDNSGLAAYAQTNSYIHKSNTQARKHGPRTMT